MQSQKGVVRRPSLQPVMWSTGSWMTTTTMTLMMTERRRSRSPGLRKVGGDQIRGTAVISQGSRNRDGKLILKTTLTLTRCEEDLIVADINKTFSLDRSQALRGQSYFQIKVLRCQLEAEGVFLDKIGSLIKEQTLSINNNVRMMISNSFGSLLK